MLGFFSFQYFLEQSMHCHAGVTKEGKLVPITHTTSSIKDKLPSIDDVKFISDIVDITRFANFGVMKKAIYEYVGQSIDLVGVFSPKAAKIAPSEIWKNENGAYVVATRVIAMCAEKVSLMGDESIQGLLEEYVGHSNRVKLTPEIQEALEKAQTE